jgi:hypothetical protein
LERSKWHKSLTDEVILEATVRRNSFLDDPGFCVSCGHEQGQCEPDAREYECEVCGEKAVYGDEELLMETAIYDGMVAAIGDRR